MKLMESHDESYWIFFENVATPFVWDVLALFIILHDAPLNLREVLVAYRVHASSMQIYTEVTAQSKETLTTPCVLLIQIT